MRGERFLCKTWEKYILVGDKLEKTASCQLEFSGGKRKQDIIIEEIIEDRKTGGQPNKLSKYLFLHGNKTN